MKLSPEASKRIGTAMAEAMAKAAKGQKEGAGIAAGIGAAAREILAAVEQELEDRRTMAFQGPHDVAKVYRPGAVVQRAGGIHVAMTATSETPGSSNHWRRIGGHNE